MEKILIPNGDLDFYNWDIDCIISIINICDEFRLGNIKPQDILSYREKKELKIQGKNSKFSKNMQDKIRSSLNHFEKEGIISYYEYRNFYLVRHYFNLQSTYLAPKKILSLNPKKELWGKIFALEIYKRRKEQIQIKKLFKNVIISDSYKPYKIRDMFEENMDNLCLKKIIKSWHYKTINEADFVKKDWLHQWFKLSVIVKV